MDLQILPSIKAVFKFRKKVLKKGLYCVIFKTKFHSQAAGNAWTGCMQPAGCILSRLALENLFLPHQC
jgi:hypothetical protein